MFTTNLYKTAAELKITEEERDGLIDFVANPPPADEFSMLHWCKCVRGTIRRRAGAHMLNKNSVVLDEIYMAGRIWKEHGVEFHCATPEQAAGVVASFLTGIKVEALAV